MTPLTACWARLSREARSLSTNHTHCLHDEERLPQVLGSLFHEEPRSLEASSPELAPTQPHRPHTRAWAWGSSPRPAPCCPGCFEPHLLAPLTLALALSYFTPVSLLTH